MSRLRGLCIGAGYFSQFHLDAWQRIDDVEIVAVCDQDQHKAEAAAQEFGIAQAVDDAERAMAELELDFVDIITRPPTHRTLVEQAAARRLAIICQKPLAPTLDEAREIVRLSQQAGTRFMVHENFRFQPWHRELKRLLDDGAIGSRLHSLTFVSRSGDGWGENAYLDRQPYFRTMPRLLVYETGVHFIDTFRYLAGEMDEVYAILRRLNPVIQGEDAGLLTFRFANGAVGVWDANRCNEGLDEDPRYTFGNFLIEGDEGSLRLYGDGRITIQRRGEPEVDHPYEHRRRSFAGDCVRATQQHFVDCLKSGQPFEVSGQEYLRTLAVQEAIYESARQNRPVAPREMVDRYCLADMLTGSVTDDAVAASTQGKRVVDLSLPIDSRLTGAEVTSCKTIDRDGWNATTLTLYSHCGTHMDAPRHFIEGGRTIDEQDLSVCIGPVIVIDLTPTAPRQLIEVEHLGAAADQVQPGDRLLFRTDWHRRFGQPEYRHELPRISLSLAKWLVEKQVALIGVEPPSVADVNNMEELTAVHQVLLAGGVVIVEGLARLDQLCEGRWEFIALPLRIGDGDGCPVRAIAVQSP